MQYFGTPKHTQSMTAYKILIWTEYFGVFWLNYALLGIFLQVSDTM